MNVPTGILGIVKVSWLENIDFRVHPSPPILHTGLSNSRQRRNGASLRDGYVAIGDNVITVFRRRPQLLRLSMLLRKFKILTATYKTRSCGCSYLEKQSNCFSKYQRAGNRLVLRILSAERPKKNSA